MKKEKQSFESSLKRLEEIVQKLEKGDIALDDSIELYQDGITLAGFCSKKLDEAKGKIEIVIKGKESPKKKDFEVSSVGDSKSSGGSKDDEELF